MKKILSVRAVFLLLLPLLLQAGPGTASIDVLKVPTGIKAQAMGGAYIGLAEGLDAMDINPAGISFISKNEILFVHDVYFQDTFFDSIYYGRGMGESGSFAVSLKYLIPEPSLPPLKTRRVITPAKGKKSQVLTTCWARVMEWILESYYLMNSRKI